MTRLLVVAALLVACKKDPVPSCAQVTDHLLEVTKQAMPGHDMEMGNRQQMIQQCEARKLTATERKCLMKAKTFPELGECRAKEQPAPTRPLPTPAPTAPAPTAPAPTAPAPAAPAPTGSAPAGSNG